MALNISFIGNFVTRKMEKLEIDSALMSLLTISFLRTYSKRINVYRLISHSKWINLLIYEGFSKWLTINNWTESFFVTKTSSKPSNLVAGMKIIYENKMQVTNHKYLGDISQKSKFEISFTYSDHRWCQYIFKGFE